MRSIAKRFHVRFSASAQGADPRGGNRFSVVSDKLGIDCHERAVLAKNDLTFIHNALLTVYLI
jgi:hypothetical protein